MKEGKFVKRLVTPFLSETFYIDEAVKITISKLDKKWYKSKPFISNIASEVFSRKELYRYYRRVTQHNKGQKEYTYRFKAEWDYNGDHYECIYGYGIDPKSKFSLNEEELRGYGYTDTEVSVVKEWFKG